MNYVFYVTERDTMCGNTISSRKQESETYVAGQIAVGLGKCTVCKYTEYHGELISGDCVGIVFPSRSWGISLAVYSFLQNLRVSKGTYVYAVAAGEQVMGNVSSINMRSIKSLEQFKNAFAKRFICTDNDIYIRSVDRVRSIEDTEYIMYGSDECRTNVKCILNGLQYYSVSDVEKIEAIGSKVNKQMTDKNIQGNNVYEYMNTKIIQKDNVHKQRNTKNIQSNNAYSQMITKDVGYVKAKEKSICLSNVFLDDSLFMEDTVCRVI